MHGAEGGIGDTDDQGCGVRPRGGVPGAGYKGCLPSSPPPSSSSPPHLPPPPIPQSPPHPQLQQGLPGAACDMGHAHTVSQGRTLRASWFPHGQSCIPPGRSSSLSPPGPLFPWGLVLVGVGRRALWARG